MSSSSLDTVAFSIHRSLSAVPGVCGSHKLALADEVILGQGVLLPDSHVEDLLAVQHVELRSSVDRLVARDSWVLARAIGQVFLGDAARKGFRGFFQPGCSPPKGRSCPPPSSPEF